MKAGNRCWHRAYPARVDSTKLSLCKFIQDVQHQEQTNDDSRSRKLTTLSNDGRGKWRRLTTSSHEISCSASAICLVWLHNALGRWKISPIFYCHGSILVTRHLRRFSEFSTVYFLQLSWYHNRHLKPGGWLEFQCINGTLSCDDNTVLPDSQFLEYDRLLRAAASKFGTPLEDPAQYARWFAEAGFVGVTETIFKMPTSPWTRDKRLRTVGMFEQDNLTQNLEGISTRVFQKGLGWGAEELTVFLAGVRKDIADRRQHTYYPFTVVYAQKPFRAA